jgi:hypothetical protein
MKDGGNDGSSEEEETECGAASLGVSGYEEGIEKGPNKWSFHSLFGWIH